ncbi:MAG: hypothetical protein ACE5HS_18760 [bacterium]
MNKTGAGNLLPLLFTVLWLCSQLNQAVAQEESEKRKFGISASLQSSQFDILLPFWLDDKTVIAPAVNVVFIEDGATDLGIGIAPSIYLRTAKAAPYISARVGSFLNNIEGGNSTTDWLLGLAFGGEYFFDPKFSIDVETQVNATISDAGSLRFGNPGGFNLNTGTAVIASIYF